MVNIIMTSGLKPYPAYKDSGVEWLGEVPVHWEVQRADRRLSVVKHPVDPNDISDQQVVHYSIPNVQQAGTGVIESGLSIDSAKTLVNRILLLVSKLNPRKGTIALAAPDPEFTTLASSEFVAMEPKLCLGEFARFLYESEYVRLELSSRVDSATKSHQRCSPEDISKLPVPWPPLVEQAAIVRFLDHADRRIQHYIRAKRKLIALLEEQKQAIIHQAVTGQIDVRTGRRYPAYKHSGVDWLGEVPKHWEMVRNGRLFGQRNEIGFPELPILEVSLRTGVRIRDFENSDRKQVMSDRNMYKRAARGDIAYNMMRMWQGAVGLTPVDGLVSPAYVVAKPMPGTEPRYYDALFRTRRYMAEVDRFSRGIVKDRNRLYWEDFKQMSAPCPPTDEQAQIARAIDHNIAIIDKRKHRIEGQISFLREYRTRLIADVVTGKLDVRKAAAELPEDDVQDDADESEAEYTSEHPTM